MNILYIGDIMAEPGIEVVDRVLSNHLIKDKVDLIIAQAENVSEGRGITKQDYDRLKKLGIGFFTGGNWTMYRQEIYGALSSPSEPIIRPANYSHDTPGLGYKYIKLKDQSVLVISLLGSIVGKDADKPKLNPLVTVDKILSETQATKPDAIIVNFHGDYSSEKVIIGHYLDGRVSAVIGDHWHVPTADARILTNGTAHISDVGMCGTLNSSLGVSFDSVITRWRDGVATRNKIETSGPKQFNAVLIETETPSTSKSIQPIQFLI
jgi:hypothetical protein